MQPENRTAAILMHALNELIAASTDGLTDDQTLEHVARLVDASAGSASKQGTERAFAILDALEQRNLTPEQRVLAHYYRANAWDGMPQDQTDESTWAWDLPQLQSQLLELRRATGHAGFESIDSLRKCQILTNLGNQLSHIGRSIEAIELFDRALAIIPNFAMALGNRGITLEAYARSQYDGGHAHLLMAAAHDSFAAAVAPEAQYEVPPQLDAASYFNQRRIDIAQHIDIPGIRTAVSLDGHSLGRSTAERRYRSWCLQHRLFLNPLNDLGSPSISAADVLTLPPLIAKPAVYPPAAFGFFNQLKQEYVSARYLCFEGATTDTTHFSDRGVKISNTLDYPSHSLTVEKLRAAFRVLYSLMDKIAFFINHYFQLGMQEQSVSIRTIWYESDKLKNRTLRPVFKTGRNWPLRGLFWLAKDIFHSEFKRVTEPDAELLTEIRNHLEHRYLQIFESWGPPPFFSTDAGAPEAFGMRIGRDEFAAKTLRLVRLCRVALIYLGLGIHSEERTRQSSRPDGLVMPTIVDSWEDRWKR